MSVSSLWLAVDLDVLAMGTAALFFGVASFACVVAAETANQIFASGRSAARPGASPDVEHSPGAAPPAAGECWAAGADAVFPSHASPGGPPTQF